jgi:hypothetical protein
MTITIVFIAERRDAGMRQKCGVNHPNVKPLLARTLGFRRKV